MSFWKLWKNALNFIWLLNIILLIFILYLLSIGATNTTIINSFGFTYK